MFTKKETSTLSMTAGPIIKTLILFALPMMASNMCQQAYVLCDTAIVGRFLGVSSLAAVGNSDWFYWMVVGSVIGFTQGFTIRMAQEFGAEAYVSLRKTTASICTLSFVVAVIYTVFAEIIIAPVLFLLQTPDEILYEATLYLRVLYGGIPVIVAYNASAAMLRALGNSKLPLVAVVVSSIFNIFMDLFLVVGCGLGVAGAALATVSGNLIAALICFWGLSRISVIRPQKEDFQPNLSEMAALIRLGLPIGLQNMIISIGGMILQRLVNTFGVLFIAGFTATNKIFGLMEAAGVSYGNAVSTFTGQNKGAGQYKRIREGVRKGAWMAVGTSLGIAVIMLIFGRPILSLFISGTPEEVEETLYYAYRYLAFMTVLLPVLYLLYNYRAALQGLGNTMAPMISGILELCLRVGVAVILTQTIGSDGIFYAEISAWAGAALMLYIIYRCQIRNFPPDLQIT